MKLFDIKDISFGNEKINKTGGRTINIKRLSEKLDLKKFLKSF